MNFCLAGFYKFGFFLYSYLNQTFSASALTSAGGIRYKSCFDFSF